MTRQLQSINGKPIRNIVFSPEQASNVLRGIRQRLNMKQTEVARELHLTPSAVSQCESGDRVLSLDTIMRFADFYGFEVRIKFVAKE